MRLQLLAASPMRLLVFAGVACLVAAAKPSLKDFPSLLDVDLDDLVTGLEGGLFTSVDLVKVSPHH